MKTDSNITKKISPLPYWDISHTGWPCYTARYFNEENALRLFDASDKTKFKLTSGVMKVGFFTDSNSYPAWFMPHHKELCFVGEVVSHITRTTRTRYYTSPENMDLMQAYVVARQKETKDRNDRYYSQPWV